MGDLSKRKIIVGGRRSGKTTDLVKLSKELNIPILLTNHSQKHMVEKMAEYLDLEIPKPLVISGLSDVEKLKGTTTKEVLVDQADMLLEALLGLNVKAMTLTEDGSLGNSSLEFKRAKT